jgi:ABC-type uncharacterized transport system ATPase subunit
MTTLRVENVSKRFGTLVALDDVSVNFQSGEIHAVLGENGAGKSTLMNALSGFVKPDRGKILLNGEPIPLGLAFACKRIGIEMIHQHFTLVPAFTVQENLALARLGRLASTADAKKLSKPAIDASEALGWPLVPQVRTGQLPVGIQQRVEILKAISGHADVLIFDEPTAVLSPDEVNDLFRVLRRLKEEGKCVILIAHKLSEVLGIADRVTVLRRGMVVASALRADVDAPTLANWMVGEMPPRTVRGTAYQMEGGLQAERLTILGDRREIAVREASFEVRRGEILGFGGVDGNGQVELAECLAQVRPALSGSQKWSGKEASNKLPRIGYVPQDRQVDGLALRMTLQDNMLVSGMDRHELWIGPFVKLKAVARWANSLIKRYSIKAASANDLAGSLSGGNQQKVVVSRTLDNAPSLLVVVNPGRGLDIKATEYVYDMILAARDNGAAVALFSTDLDELYKLSDRVLFMVGGELVEDSGAASMVGGDR